MKKSKEKPLPETELRRYWTALKQWDLDLQKREQELDAREAELDSLVDEDGEPLFCVPEPTTDAGNITSEVVQDAYNRICAREAYPAEIDWEAIGRPRPVMCREEFQKYIKPAAFPVTLRDDCTTPEEFATTIKCGPGCYAGIHATDCPVNVYLEVERLAKLEDKRP